MFGDRFPREFVQRVYLMNGKNFEVTLDKFLTENLPEVDAKPQFTIIETSAHDSQIISTGASVAEAAGSGRVNQVDMRSYVLDEYKELLFPKHMKKYEQAH